MTPGFILAVTVCVLDVALVIIVLYIIIFCSETTPTDRDKRILKREGKRVISIIKIENGVIDDE